MAHFKRRRRARQLQLAVPARWGGARTGAGRPPILAGRPKVRHRARPDHDSAHPVHVTARARPGVPSLRHERPFRHILAAIARASRAGFRVLHFSVQTDHIHLVVEANHRRALLLGTRGLLVRLARAVNRALARKGPVWTNRYHARALQTPRETRAALLYVLQNWKKHLPSARGIDGRSSAPWFDGWADAPRRATPPAATARPTTWLARTGWHRRGGGLLRTAEAPSPGARPRG